MKAYLESLDTIIKQGDLIPNRTGVPAYVYPHIMLRHDMSDGFPLLTTKKMAWKSIKVELEFFIKGITDKKWLQERNCHIWDEWCNPKKIPSGLSELDRKKFQLEENDLGKIYGRQWRNFNSQRFDQLKWIVDQLKINPHNRQLVCSAWNPIEMEEQALPPCHVLWHVFVTKDKLHLSWFQRSVDFFLGEPFNLASFALLLHLLAKETGYKEGVVTGFLSNCHVYQNHIEVVQTQMKRKPYDLPSVQTNNFTNIFNWNYKDTVLASYQSHPAIKANIAV